MNLRPEEPRDFDAIRALDLAAFAPSELEADIADGLRAADDHVPDLCLVAVEDDDDRPGHVMLSRAHVGEYPALGLGPIAVDPAHQHHGIGGALMREAIERASRTEYPLIALLGHPRTTRASASARPRRPSASRRTTRRRPRHGWRSRCPPTSRTSAARSATRRRSATDARSRLWFLDIRAVMGEKRLTAVEYG